MAAPEQAGSRSVAHNAVARSIGEVVAKLASVVFFVAIARELGEGGFGDFVFALSFTTVLMLAAGFGTEELVAREVSRDRARLDDYVSNSMLVKLATSLVLLAFAAIFVNVAGYSEDARAAVYLVGAGVAVESLGRTWGSVFQAYGRMDLLSVSLILQRTATAGAGIAVLAAGGDILAVSLVFFAGSLLGFGVAAVVLRRYVVRPRMAIDRSRWWPIVRAAAPIGLVTLVLTVLVKVDQTLISFLSGGDNREVGFYGAAFRLVEATMFISWSFAAAFLPWVARRGDDEAERIAQGYALALKALTAVLLPIGVVFALLADPLINLFYGERYEAAVEPLRWLGIMTLFYGLNTLASHTMIARDRPFEFARICGVVVVLNVGLNLALIPPLGATGAAIAAAVSSVALALLGMRKIRSLTGRLDVLRAFAAPVLAGAAMAGVLLVSSLPLVPNAALGAMVYALVLLVLERRLYPADLELARGLLRRGRGTPPEPGLPVMEAS
jgi:O-antigen/teichoic acid export membrane protein